jgi:nucleoid-associated protein YgaU
MPVFRGSRYEQSFAGRVVHSDGVVKPVLFRAPVEVDAVASVYQTVQGDRLDTLSFLFFGTEFLWWLIADANPSLLLPDPLPPGTILRIPRGTPVN